MQRKPFFYDITLRDGNQSLKKPWSLEEKIFIFDKIVQLGINAVELGFPASSEMDFQACQTLANMADEKNLKLAKSVYNSLCEMLDEKNVRYDKQQDDLIISFITGGDDIPMQFLVKVDAERELIRVLSPIPVTFGEEKRVEGAIATCHATYALADGSFDYDFQTGKVLFRLTSQQR